MTNSCGICFGHDITVCAHCKGAGKEGGIFGIGQGTCPRCDGEGVLPCPAQHGAERDPTLTVADTSSEQVGVRLLLRSLAKGTWRAREVSARALEALGNLDAVGPLIDALGDDRDNPAGHDFVKPAVASALGTLGDRRAVPVLIDFLQDFHTMASAATALGALGDVRAVEPLIALMGNADREWAAREAAATALGELGDSRAVEPLIKNLIGCRYHGFKKAAAQALGALGGSSVSPLVAILTDPVEEVGVTAAHSLGALGRPDAISPLVASLGAVTPPVRAAIADALGVLGETRWKDWIRGDSSDFDRIGQNGDPMALAILVKALEGYESRAAARALGELGDKRAVEPLIRSLLDNRKKRESAAVARALGELGDSSAVEPLLQALNGSTDDFDLLAATATALGALGDVRAIGPLIVSVLVFASSRIRESPLVALSQLGEPGWQKWVRGDERASVAFQRWGIIGPDGSLSKSEPVAHAPSRSEELVNGERAFGFLIAAANDGHEGVFELLGDLPALSRAIADASTPDRVEALAAAFRTAKEECAVEHIGALLLDIVGRHIHGLSARDLGSLAEMSDRDFDYCGGEDDPGEHSCVSPRTVVKLATSELARRRT